MEGQGTFVLCFSCRKLRPGQKLLVTLTSEILAALCKAVTAFLGGWKVRPKGKEPTRQVSPNLLQLIPTPHPGGIMVQPLCGRVHALSSNPGSPHWLLGVRKC